MNFYQGVSTQKKSVFNRALVLAIAALCTAPAAQASFIDHGNYFEDTATNLDWLDIALTDGLTYNQVLPLISGGSLAGWGYATSAQFNTLVGGIIGNVNYDGSFVTVSNVQVSLLISAFGGGTAGSVSSPEFYAITGNVGGNGHLIIGAYAPSSGNGWISGSLGTQSDSSNGGNYGSLLIRTHVASQPGQNVPEPGMLGMLGLGIATLVVARRRKQSL